MDTVQQENRRFLNVQKFEIVEEVDEYICSAFLQQFRFIDICLAIMNILNKGRCARCSASETKEIKVGTLIKGCYKVKIWRFCNKYEKYCRYCSNRCKAPPMGIQK